MACNADEGHSATNMMPWTFRVTCIGEEVGEGEFVAVTGSSSELGMWRPEASLPLTDDGHGVWSVAANLVVTPDLRYRYCICLRPNDQREDVVIIRRWEATHKARKITSHNGISNTHT